jgi:hypothetical protein
MTLAQFITQFDSVLEAFGRNKFPMIVLERIHTKVGDLSPPQITELCNLLIDSCEHAPKTSKVCEFANIIRARYRNGINDKEIQEIPINCNACDDLGVIRAIATDQSHESLLRCSCAEGFLSTWDIPQYSRDWAPLYRREKCPVSWFKPIRHEGPIIKKSGVFVSDVERKMEYWRAKITIATEFWKQMKTEHV